MKGEMDTYFTEVFDKDCISKDGTAPGTFTQFYNIEDLFRQIRRLENDDRKYVVYGAIYLLDRS